MVNIILCGVGGQGTVLASKILASAAGARGESAHTAETIGMAQRGGSVVSHVRIGEGAYSPLIAKGCADAIIAFEPAEAVRAFPYLKKGGSVTVSSSPVKPVTDSLADKPYSADDMIEFLEKQDIRLTVVDGGEIIRKRKIPQRGAHRRRLRIGCGSVFRRRNRECCAKRAQGGIR